MGVKSTQILTRAEAEHKYVELKLALSSTRRELRAEAVLMRNADLEDVLANLNDEACGGEGFENYTIED